MSSKTKSAIPTIEEIPLKDLIIDNALSGRTEKEIQQNAKALAPLMEAHGMWDARQPGEYFTRGGKKHLIAGFTRTAAAQLNGLKVGYFIEVPDDATQLRTACIRTNAGKPISASEQGRIYAAMRAGSDPEKLAVGETALPAMKEADIAKEVGVSRQWVDNCIAVFEAPAEIGELILAGKLSPNVYNRVRQVAKTLPAQMKIINAATKAAADEGKECATMKHFESIKAQFVEPKKLKATTATQPELPANTTSQQSETKSPTTAESSVSNEAGTKSPDTTMSDDTAAEKSNPSSTAKAPVQSLADLGADSETVHKKKLEKYRKAIIEAINGCDADGRFAFEDSDVEFIADAVMKISVPF